jgi:hypothetical protein
MVRLQLKRGLKQDLPNSGLLEGEPLVALDTGELFIAVAEDDIIPVVPAIEHLNLVSPMEEQDSFMIYDHSAQRAGRIRLTDLVIDCGLVADLDE